MISGQVDSAELKRRIKLLENELRDAQKMTSLGELVGTTTHEFNNVLMTIINYAKLGLRHRDDATRDKSLDNILKAARRAEKITNSVLGLARNRGNDFAPTALVPLIDEALVLLERELQKYRISIERTIEEVPPIWACANQLQQVMLNLLTNARQAMPNGGRVLINLAFDKQQGFVTLTIRDTGEGIPSEKLPRIFDRYYTTKSGPDETGKGGTGVGLSMCRDIIEEHKGRIRVESRVGKGTAFTLKFPPHKRLKARTNVRLGVPSAIAPVITPNGNIAPTATT